jgi:hypothetical protein
MRKTSLLIIVLLLICSCASLNLESLKVTKNKNLVIKRYPDLEVSQYKKYTDVFEVYNPQSGEKRYAVTDSSGRIYLFKKVTETIPY